MKNRMEKYTGYIICLMVLGVANAGAAQDRDVPEDVDQLVRDMSDLISGVRYFSFEVEDTIDEVLENGQKVQYSHRRSAIVDRRGNKLRIDTSGDIANRSVWKDGKTITMLDRTHNVYGQIDDPGTIDEAIDYMATHYGVSLPLADLLSENPYDVLMREVRSGQYVGLHSVGVFDCHHLAFTQDEIDWQIWIDAGDQPVVRKLVITYKSLPAQPQYVMTILRPMEFDTIPVVGAFVFKAPEGAEKIEFLPIDGEETGTAPRDE